MYFQKMEIYLYIYNDSFPIEHGSFAMFLDSRFAQWRKERGSGLHAILAQAAVGPGAKRVVWGIR